MINKNIPVSAERECCAGIPENLTTHNNIAITARRTTGPYFNITINQIRRKCIGTNTRNILTAISTPNSKIDRINQPVTTYSLRRKRCYLCRILNPYL